MAGSPNLKVYTRDGEYVASCKYASDAACLVAQYGDGATVRYGHRSIVYQQGKDGDAGKSFDAAGAVIDDRVKSLFKVGAL